MQKFFAWLLFIIFTMPSISKAQPLTLKGPDRISIGATGGLFRISFNDFTKFYSGRAGFSWGGHLSLRISTPYNVIFKYRRFDKTADFQGKNQTYSLGWKEEWFNIGLRYLGTEREKISNYFSFGFAFFSILEKGGASVFSGELQNANRKKTNASGFFIDLGLHYPITPRLAVLFDMEITSAGMRGKSGFEGSSVGGFYFGGGLAAFLF